jgi:hypothetical protein
VLRIARTSIASRMYWGVLPALLFKSRFIGRPLQLCPKPVNRNHVSRFGSSPHLAIR